MTKHAPRHIDAAAKATFRAALRDGRLRDEAAALAGFTANGFYYARKADPAFALAWAWAAELAAADLAAARARTDHADPDPDVAAAPGAVTIVPNANRRLQRRGPQRQGGGGGGACHPRAAD